MGEERLTFQAEVSKLLEIVANALYSNKETFLRELISNASDACDRLRYVAITRPELIADESEFRIRVAVDRKARTITVSDNGIGMNREEMIANLGTIARSGTQGFLDQLTGEKDADVSLIGQFGVGFYSAFMVAKKVEVTSRRAGEEGAWRWTSDGKGSFTIAEAERERRGTDVVLHIRKDSEEFLDPERLRRIVKTYSDHIPIPIVLADGESEETVNEASALWTRPKSEITADQYREFYHHVAHAFDDPWLTVHYKAEGKIEYTALLFVPSSKPLDLFHPDRKHRVKLYVKRVFITEDCEDLLPGYLRFLRGIVDSEDLPLNISREMLQHNPVLARIRQGLVKRVLAELGKKADKAPDEYATFWEHFGAVLKEGLYEDPDRRDTLFKLARFHSTAGEGLVSLDDYVGRMKKGQEAIYTITADDLETARRSPQLEGFLARGVEVLLLTDPVDEFWVPAVGSYRDKPFKSVTMAGADLSAIEAGKADGKAAKDGEEAADGAAVDALVALLKLTLKDAVKDVRPSERLTESPVCLVADEGDLDIHLERLLKQHRQIETTSKRILEINPRHALIRRLAALVKADGASGRLEDAAFLLLDQARIVEGDPLPDPAAFSRRLAAMMEAGLAAPAEAAAPAG